MLLWQTIKILLGKFLNDGTWSNKNENDINDSVLIGHALEKNIFSKNKQFD